MPLAYPYDMNAPMIPPDDPNYDSVWAEYNRAQAEKGTPMWRSALTVFELGSVAYLAANHVSKKQQAKMDAWTKNHPPKPPKKVTEIVIDEIKSAYLEDHPDRVWTEALGAPKLHQMLRQSIEDNSNPHLVIEYEDWGNSATVSIMLVAMVSGVVRGYVKEDSITA